MYRHSKTMHGEGIKCSLGTNMLKAHSLTNFFRQILSHWLKFIRNHKKRGGTHLLLIDCFSRFYSFQYISCSKRERIQKSMSKNMLVLPNIHMQISLLNIQNKVFSTALPFSYFRYSQTYN